MNHYNPYGSIQLGGISSPVLNQPPRVGDHTTQLQRDHTTQLYGCQPKNSGKTPKMDGLFHGKPYEQMDDLGGFTIIFGSTSI